MGNSEARFDSFESPCHYFIHGLGSALCCHSFCSSNMTSIVQGLALSYLLVKCVEIRWDTRCCCAACHYACLRK